MNLIFFVGDTLYLVFCWSLYRENLNTLRQKETESLSLLKLFFNFGNELLENRI